MLLTKLRVVLVVAVIILSAKMALWTHQTLAQAERGGKHQPEQPAVAPAGKAAETPRGPAAACDKNPDAVTQKSEGAYRVWKVTGAVDSLAWSPDSMRLAIQTKPVKSETSSKIELWSVNEGRLERVLYETDGPIFSVEFSPGGKSLACAAWPVAGMRFEEGADGSKISEVRLLDVVGGELTRTLEVATKDEVSR